MDGVLRLRSMALKCGNGLLKKCPLKESMTSNDPYFTYEQRRNTKVNIQSAIYHKVFQMRQIIQYTTILMPVDTFGGQKQSQLEGNSRIHIENTFEYHFPTPTNPNMIGSL